MEFLEFPYCQSHLFVSDDSGVFALNARVA